MTSFFLRFAIGLLAFLSASTLVTPLAALVFLALVFRPALDDEPFVSLCHIASSFDFHHKRKRLATFSVRGVIIFSKEDNGESLYN